MRIHQLLRTELCVGVSSKAQLEAAHFGGLNQPSSNMHNGSNRTDDPCDRGPPFAIEIIQSESGPGSVVQIELTELGLFFC